MDTKASGFLVRLPESLREPLKKLKDKTGQPFTWAVSKALEDHLKAHGISIPKSGK